MDDLQKTITIGLRKDKNCFIKKDVLEKALNELVSEKLKVNLLLYAFNEKIVVMLLKDSDVNAIEALVNQLIDNYGVSEENSRWAVATWCYVLGKHDIAMIIEHKIEDEVSKEKTDEKEIVGGSVLRMLSGSIGSTLFDSLVENIINYVDRFMKGEIYNEGSKYEDEMVEYADLPIKLYKSVYHEPVNCLFVDFYCRIKRGFEKTKANKVLSQYKSDPQKPYEVFNITVAIKFDEFYIDKDKVVIERTPEISILPDDMEGISMEVESAKSGMYGEKQLGSRGFYYTRYSKESEHYLGIS